MHGRQPPANPPHKARLRAAASMRPFAVTKKNKYNQSNE